MPRRYQRKQPTLKQIKAIQYINQGMSAYKAMKKAGYTKESAMKPKQVLFARKGVQSMIMSMGMELEAAGLTSKYMVGKFKEWLEAQKMHSTHTEPDKNIPDYETQIKAYDRWEKIVTRGEQGAVAGNVKRKLTIEEFVTGEENNAPT